MKMPKVFFQKKNFKFHEPAKFKFCHQMRWPYMCQNVTILLCKCHIRLYKIRVNNFNFFCQQSLIVNWHITKNGAIFFQLNSISSFDCALKAAWPFVQIYTILVYYRWNNMEGQKPWFLPRPALPHHSTAPVGPVILDRLWTHSGQGEWVSGRSLDCSKSP